MVLYVLYYVCVFSLHQKSPDKILENKPLLRWFCHIELDWHCRTDRPAKRRVGMGDGTKLFVNMCVLFLCAPLQPWAVAPQTKGVILFVGARSTLAFKDPACQ
jgi:hypothetical protein